MYVRIFFKNHQFIMRGSVAVCGSYTKYLNREERRRLGDAGIGNVAYWCIVGGMGEVEE